MSMEMERYLSYATPELTSEIPKHLRHSGFGWLWLLILILQNQSGLRV